MGVGELISSKKNVNVHILFLRSIFVFQETSVNDKKTMLTFFSAVSIHCSVSKIVKSVGLFTESKRVPIGRCQFYPVQQIHSRSKIIEIASGAEIFLCSKKAGVCALKKLCSGVSHTLCLDKKHNIYQVGQNASCLPLMQILMQRLSIFT